MENKGLLFIPDISGFTRFVSETEIEHSRMIIQELLEVLINANSLQLEISEIEGDAILFYKYGDPPPLETLYAQVKQMFCAFHQRLIAYEHRRYCQCEACNPAIGLTLKIITHYGEFTGYNVKQFSKLIGKDIIVAHQLLKNNIEQHEYWLVSKTLHEPEPRGPADWMHWQSSWKETETGNVMFHYTQLGNLRNGIEPEKETQLQLADKEKVLSLSRDYDTDIITLFHATGDFNYRNRWAAGVEKVEEVDHLLPRVGMRCRCVLSNGQVMIYSSSYSFTPDKIEFSETAEEQKSVTYFILEKNGGKTKLTIDYYIQDNLLNRLSYRFAQRKKLEADMNASLKNLIDLVKELEQTKNR